MTEKRFTDVEVDKYYGLICMSHDGQFHSYSEQSLEDLLNAFNEENEQLKEQIEYQQEVIVDTIDSLMELPSVTLYLSKQWLDACEDYDSIEDMKNTFSERIKELEE